MKITITTWYEIETADGELRTLKAQTDGVTLPSQVLQLLPVFDIHTEKVGAIERKLLKSHEE